MGDDATALVARLEARVDKFEKAMKDAGGVADKAMKGIEDRFAAANKVISGKLNDMSYTASTQLGTIGTLMRTLGPAGVVAAVGIGSAVLAFNTAAQAAAQLAEKAKGIRELSASTGLTTAELQALGGAASKVGVDSDQLGAFVTKLTTNLEELRRGGGQLREELPRINPALVSQLETTRSTADAITILGRAYQNLDVFQANALSKAIGGRGAVSAVSRLLPGIDLNELTQQFQAAGKGLDDNLIKKLPQLALEAEKASKKAKENFALIFAEEVLEAQKTSANQMLRLSDAARNFSLSSDLKRFITESDWVPTWMKQAAELLPVLAKLQSGSLPAAEPTTQPPARREDDLMAAAKAKITPGLAAGRTNADELAHVWDPRLPPSAAAQLAAFKDLTSVLGAAITPAEQLKLKELELNAAIEANPRVAGAAARALDVFKLAQMQVSVAIKEQLGVATEQEMVQARIAGLRDLQAKGIIQDQAIILQAERLIQKEARATAEAMQIRASNFPQLKQMQLDAENINKSLDQFGSNAVTTMTDELYNMASGTKTAQQAFADMTKSILADLAKMALKKSILSIGSSLFSGMFAEGGLVEYPPIPQFASGGLITGPGGPRSDNILARVSPGEFIMNAAATSRFRSFLEAMNSGWLPGFAEGGLVMPGAESGGEVWGGSFLP